MKKKMVSIFLSKKKTVLTAFILLMIICSINAAYTSYLAIANQYRWFPIRQLSQDWYFYPFRDWSDEFQLYIMEEYQAEFLYDFMREKGVGTENGGWDEAFTSTNGCVFQVEEEQYRMLIEKFANAAYLIPLSEQVQKYGSMFNDIGGMELLIGILIWLLAFAAALLWFRKSVEESEEELRYLSYAGHSLKTIRKIYCFAHWRVIFVAWVLSAGAVFLPNVYGDYGIAHPMVTLIMLLVNGLLFFLTGLLFYQLFRSILDDLYHQFDCDKMSEEENQRIYIGELSVKDNLILILMAQGYSEKAAEQMTEILLAEREIRFCANRLMEQMAGGDERIKFFEIQDQLLIRDGVKGY